MNLWFQLAPYSVMAFIRVLLTPLSLVKGIGRMHSSIITFYLPFLCNLLSHIQCISQKLQNKKNGTDLFNQSVWEMLWFQNADISSFSSSTKFKYSHFYKSAKCLPTTVRSLSWAKRLSLCYSTFLFSSVHSTVWFKARSMATCSDWLNDYININCSG